MPTKSNRQAAYAYKLRKGLIKNPGVGKGGAPHSGVLNAAWDGGKSLHMKHRNHYRLSIRYCESCREDLKYATHYEWVMHHIDHDNTNNPSDRSNWKLLCKRCHQVHHKCWLAFEGATTIPRGSRI